MSVFLLFRSSHSQWRGLLRNILVLRVCTCADEMLPATVLCSLLEGRPFCFSISLFHFPPSLLCYRLGSQASALACACVDEWELLILPPPPPSKQKKFGRARHFASRCLFWRAWIPGIRNLYISQWARAFAHKNSEFPYLL